MTLPTSQDAVAQAERRAREAEESPLPVLLKIGKVIVWAIWAIALACSILLLLAFVLRLFGANAEAPFAEWVYRTSDSLMRPFRGIFPPHQITDTSIFDASLLFGALMYLIAALLVDALLRWITHRLRVQEQKARVARATADAAAQQLASQEYALRRAAEHDYAVARAAAEHVVATQQAVVVPAQPPSPPTPPPPTV